MDRVLTMLFGGCLLLAGGASQAAEQGYLLRGNRSPSDGAAYIEVWGHAVNGVEPYAIPGPSFDDLMAGANAATHAALLPFTAAWARVSYDPTLAPLSTAPNGRSASYAAGPLSLSMGGGADVATMASSEIGLNMLTLANAARQYFTIATRPTGPWGQALPGIAFSYAAPPVPRFGVDLLNMIGPASGAYTRGFDLAGFDSLPVRLDAPTLFRPVWLGVGLSRAGAPGTFDTSVPASLALADWPEASMDIVFDGVFGVSVDRDDYASDEAFAAASDWVSTHIRQIHYETGMSFDVTSITPVPEPAGGPLLALGLGALLSCRRVRGHRPIDPGTMPSALPDEAGCASLVTHRSAIEGPAAAPVVYPWRVRRGLRPPKGCVMNRVLMTMLGGLLLLAGAARAADQSYVLQGSRGVFDGGGFLEVWGYSVDGKSPYAAIDSYSTHAFDQLMEGAKAATYAALAPFATASARLSYDPTSAPLSTGANGRTATYATGPISIAMVDGSEGTVSMTSSEVGLSVYTSSNGGWQTVVFNRMTATGDGPLPGIAFSYSAAPAPQLSADLVAMIGPTNAYSRGFDLSGFASLPIRLEVPTQFRPVTLGAQLQRSGPPGSFDISAPSSLSQGGWSDATFGVGFDGVYGVTVDRDDYASDQAFAAASDWVSSHIRQINFETGVSFEVMSITAVPEPASGLLLALGLGALLSCRRSRRC